MVVSPIATNQLPTVARFRLRMIPTTATLATISACSPTLPLTSATSVFANLLLARRLTRFALVWPRRVATSTRQSTPRTAVRAAKFATIPLLLSTFPRASSAPRRSATSLMVALLVSTIATVLPLTVARRMPKFAPLLLVLVLPPMFALSPRRMLVSSLRLLVRPSTARRLSARSRSLLPLVFSRVPTLVSAR